MRWAAYRGKRGSFNNGMRIEAGAALNAAISVNTHSKKTYKQRDFMPHADADEDTPITLSEAMESWK